MGVFTGGPVRARRFFLIGRPDPEQILRAKTGGLPSPGDRPLDRKLTQGSPRLR